MGYFSAIMDIVGTNIGITAAIVGLGFGAFFIPSPRLKLAAIVLAVVLGSNMLTYNLGVKDGKDVSDAHWKREQAKTDQKVDDAVSRSVDAVFDGVRDDPWDRANRERGNKKAR